MYRIYLISQDDQLDRRIRDHVSRAPELRWAGTYPRFVDIFEHMLEANPDQIVLVDAHHLPSEELRAICRFRAAHPTRTFVPLLRPEVAELVQLTRVNGDGAGVSRTADARRLLEAIGEAATGATAATPSQNREGRQTHHSAAARHQVLTRRETEVLQRMSMGEPQKQIAQRLGLSHHTVDNHIRSIYRKLQARSAVDAVARGFRRGILF